MTTQHRSTYVQTNNITLHVIQAGPEDAAPVILLHGFPEFWYGWRKQIDHLAAQGYRVLVPDQRGYNLSDKPRGIANYNLDLLTADVLGLIDYTGHEKAVVIGHDWGAVVAWWLGSKHPERVAKLVTLNVPHPVVMKKFLRTNAAQRRRSWYMFLFQLPWLPEYLLSRNHYRSLRRAIRRTSLPGTYSETDLDLYREAWAQPGALTATLNWYRAMFRVRPARLEHVGVTVPTLVIWGKQDKAVGWEMAQPSVDLCDDGRLELIEHATHWVQHEAADQVNRLIVEFLGA